MRYFPVVLAVGAVIAGWQYMSGRPVERAPGVLVESEPQQSLLERPEVVEFKGVRLTPRARFKADVRVLSLSRYHLGRLADVAPLDIAVGWGEMSDSAVLRGIDISQSGRFYFWHYENEPPITRAAIESHSANWHMIPADSLAWKALRGLRVGDVVTLEGQLVDVESDEGEMKTSLSRGDTGAGACEIVFVETARIGSRRSGM